ncbi:hypothetical protein C4M97_01215 [Mycoplasmopsis pullorum]|uniref:MSC_0620 family F1-like ATPase-associated subunit n=1 Tax=Mycoplasmopsis pullorum TaxID=48003 RepID=UPI001119D5C9|nr:hypothetical protein [Mycoplasmopsis pullorum]TNK81745.1 hypothetical protein C4M94_03135 [Mycoplasmopsis pullorum]TNK83074.1 hypothetical protein C4M80_01430 [Mycoplasmopsis pullorum]TNK85005.1 hypothetical protein C4M81_00570 [Mycoplasmopsis pullorum]TNK85608.1 hypothetical protein C4M92_00825 [Mycoplasmopsis pullorum]TNK86388.1 hypothetical protein C4M85_00280 [Mycoplasmopsis pullorum]
MKKNKWLILGSVSLFSTFPLVISANPTTGTTTASPEADQPTQPNEEEVQPTLDPNFDSFKKVVDLELKRQLSTIIDNKIVDLRNKANEIIRKSEKEKTEEIIKAIYYHKVADYLQRKRFDILDDPKSFGFQIIYPYVIALNKDIYVSNVIYDDREYENIKFGTVLGTTYFEDDIARKDEFTVNINAMSYAELQEQTRKYFSDLNSQFDEIFVNERDIPKLKSEKLENSDNSDTTEILFDDFYNGIEITLPNGYTEWDDYVKEKIEKRFLRFDLDRNSNSDAEETPPETPPVIPVTNPKEVTDPLDNIDAFTENVPNLTPYISFEFWENFKPEFYDEWKALSDNSNLSELNLRFKFENSVFTRYHYSIIALRKTEDRLKAVVLIRDRNNLSISRTYETEILKDDSKEFARSKEAANKLVRETIVKFYDALGIGSKITLKNLGNQELILSVFNMIVNLNKMISEKDDYHTELKKIIEKYKDTIIKSNKEKELTIESSDYIRDLMNLFLGSIERSSLVENDTNVEYQYFEYLYNTYKKVVFDARDGLKKKELKEEIIKKFQMFKFDLATLDKIFEILNFDLDYWKGLINSNTFSIQDKYNKNVEVIDKIQNILIQLAVLTNTDELDPNDTKNPKVIELKETYNRVQSTKTIGYVEKQKTLYYVVSAIFTLLGLTTLINWLVLRFSKNKKIKLGKKYSFVLIGISVMSLGIAIAMIIFAIGGI